MRAKRLRRLRRQGRTGRGFEEGFEGEDEWASKAGALKASKGKDEGGFEGFESEDEGGFEGFEGEDEGGGGFEGFASSSLRSL